MNVRKARERLGLTMAELAELSGVGISSISKIENKKKVSDKTLAKVINTLMELEHYEVGRGKHVSRETALKVQPERKRSTS